MCSQCGQCASTELGQKIECSNILLLASCCKMNLEFKLASDDLAITALNGSSTLGASGKKMFSDQFQHLQIPCWTFQSQFHSHCALHANCHCPFCHRRDHESQCTHTLRSRRCVEAVHCTHISGVATFLYHMTTVIF